MNRRRVSIQVFLCFLMIMLLMVIGCSVKDDIEDALPIHKISGTVYDSSNDGVSGVMVKLTGDESKSTTTNNDGKYEFNNLKNGNYTVKPDGYGSKIVTISNNDWSNVNFNPVAFPFHGTASGTYTWNSGTSTLTFNWTSSTFLCNGPELGTEIETGVTIGATTMIMPNANDGAGMTWTRPNGTPGDGAGTWTSTDAGSGDTYTLIVTATTVSVSADVTSCDHSSGTLSAGNYEATCHVTSDPAIPAVPSKTVKYDYTVPPGASISDIRSAVCPLVQDAVSSYCSSPSCSIERTSSTSATLNLSCSYTVVTVNEDCTMSPK